MPIDRIKGSGKDLVDVEELVDATINLDGKKALVAAAELYARKSATQSLPLRQDVPVDNTANSFNLLKVQSHLMVYNNTSWDIWKNNTEGTLLASAARTASLYSTDQTNYNHKGIYVFINVTAIVTAPQIYVRLQMKDSISGQYQTITASSTTITAVGRYIIALHPGLIDTAGIFHMACDAMLPRTWRLHIGHNNANSITYSVSYALMV